MKRLDIGGVLLSRSRETAERGSLRARLRLAAPPTQNHATKHSTARAIDGFDPARVTSPLGLHSGWRGRRTGPLPREYNIRRATQTLCATATVVTLPGDRP